MPGINAVLQRLVDERDQINRDIDHINEQSADDERDPSESERQLLTRYRQRLTEVEPMIVEQLDLEEQRRSARDASAVLQRSGARGAPRNGEPAGEPAGETPVYRNFATYARDMLISRYDAIASRAGQGVREAAISRIQRAVANTTTSDIDGLLPPQHIAQIMQVINKNRPMVQASRRLPLNNGKVTYPFITSRPTVSKQGAEKTETTSTKMQVDMVEKSAATFLGAGDLSWQAINWSTPDALGLWFDLAAEAYAQATEVEAAAVFGAAFAAPGSPVAVAAETSEAWTAAIAAAAGVVWNNSRRVSNGVACDPATFYAIAPMASNVRTVLMAEGAVNLSTQSGTLAGLQLFASPGLPADTVVVGDFTALLSAETPGAPVELRAVEPSIGGMEVGVIGAFFSTVVEGGAFCKVTPPAGAVTAARSTSTKS
jgi:HK97 family phage major capsid protein